LIKFADLFPVIMLFLLNFKPLV